MRPLPGAGFSTPPVNRDRPAHFPAIAAGGLKESSCMMVKRPGAIEFQEFPKISINIDKFTGYFDKFQKIKFFGKGRSFGSAGESCHGPRFTR